jgi:hypothetical protein
MASNGTGVSGRFALTYADDSTSGSSRFGDIAGLQLARDVVGDSEGGLASAGAAMARVKREIDHLWRDSMQTDDRATSQRLAEVSHALRRAARLLDHDDAIG